MALLCLLTASVQSPTCCTVCCIRRFYLDPIVSSRHLQQISDFLVDAVCLQSNGVSLLYRTKAGMPEDLLDNGDWGGLPYLSEA